MQLLDGRYELRALLGRGGMAEVHRAHDRVLDREVAVKVLRETADDDASRFRFAAESRLLARLDHPNLVTLLGVGTSTGHPYFVMELVEGGTLSDHLTGTPLDQATIASLGAQVADALDHAHTNGVMHRDVKPGNVLLTADGRAKLADFGIARLVGETVGVTRTGNTVGTVAYLAPEQVRGEPVTPAVDVYALGLVLLEALTGVRAYPGTSTESALARLHRSPTIPISLPHGWPRLLAAMTAADPHERPSAAGAAEALRSLAAGEPAAVVLPAPDPTVESSRAEPPRTESVPVAPGVRRTARRRLVLAGAATVAATMVGVATLAPDAAVSDERPEPATTSESSSPTPAPRDDGGTKPVSATPSPQKSARPAPKGTQSDQTTPTRKAPKVSKASKASKAPKAPKVKEPKKVGPPAHARSGGKDPGHQGKGGGRGRR